MNFHGYDWQKFLQKKFKPWTGIQKWHVIKITDELGNDLEVADYLGDKLRKFTIMNDSDILAGPPVIIPNGLSDKRHEEFKYIEEWVPEVHKSFISSFY